MVCEQAHTVLQDWHTIVPAHVCPPHGPPSAVACCIRAGYGLHTGHAILMRSNASKWPGGSTLFSLALLRSLSSGQWSPGEQQELLARRVQLLRYLLRSPCYNAFTRWVLGVWVVGDVRLDSAAWVVSTRCAVLADSELG
jgi:hypothetical protein